MIPDFSQKQSISKDPYKPVSEFKNKKVINKLKFDSARGELLGVSTFRGKFYSHQKIESNITEVFSAIQRHAYGFNKGIGQDKLKQRIRAAEKDIDTLIEIATHLGAPAKELNYLAEQRKTIGTNMTKQYAHLHQASISREAKPVYTDRLKLREMSLGAINPGKAELADDFEANLQIQSTEAFLSPLTTPEEAFIDHYLESSPARAKQQTGFELLKRKTENLEKELAEYKTEIQLNGKTYEVYGIDHAEYQLIGCAGNLNAVISDYEGSCRGDWVFICTSVIDSEHPYFQESGSHVFQAFIVPPKTIVHTSPGDLRSPFSSSPEQPGWYGMSMRVQVLTDHIDRAYNNMRLEKGETPLVTDFDHALRVKRQVVEWMRHYEGDHESPAMPGTEKLVLLLKGSVPKTAEAMEEAFHDMRAANISEKDIESIKLLIIQLNTLEAAYPKVIDKHFWIKDPTMNRVLFQMQSLKNHYHAVAPNMSDEEREEEFKKIFNCKDPSGRYDIMDELLKMETLFSRIPDFMPGPRYFQTHLNRFMGPQEILSEAKFSEHTEININTRRGDGLKVKAWVMQAELVKKNPRELQILCEFAKKEGIMILLRHNPGVYSQ